MFKSIFPGIHIFSTPAIILKPNLHVRWRMTGCAHKIFIYLFSFKLNDYVCQLFQLNVFIQLPIIAIGPI